METNVCALGVQTQQQYTPWTCLGGEWNQLKERAGSFTHSLQAMYMIHETADTTPIEVFLQVHEAHAATHRHKYPDARPGVLSNTQPRKGPHI